MYNINYILATDLNWAIGYKNGLLYFFKKDLQRFKDITRNKTVIMGSKTWESLPIKLPQRTNIVLSSKNHIEGEKQPDKIIHTIDDILNIASQEEIWIIGGATLYDALIEYVSKIELTIIHNDNVEYENNHIELEVIDIVPMNVFSNVYIEYIADCIEGNINYKEYISEKIHFNKGYANYIEDKFDDNKYIRRKIYNRRKKIIKKLLSE